MLPLIRRVAHLSLCCVVSGVLLGGRALPLQGVIRGDLHGDSSTLTWDFWNVTESVIHGRNPYRTAGLYFPVGGTLTTHTYIPGFFPVGLAARALDGDNPAWPIEAYRAAIWLSFALGMFTSYYALVALGASEVAALAGSVAWAFAPVFRSRAIQLQLVSAAFLLPVATWALARLAAAPSRGRAVAAAVVVGGCLYFSEYYTPFLWLGLALLCAAALLWRETRSGVLAAARTLGWKGLGLAASAFVVATAPFLLNWSPSKALRFRPQQAYFESANLAGFLVPDPRVTPLYARTRLARWHGSVKRGVAGTQVFVGLPVLLFAAVGAWRVRNPSGRALLIFAVAFLTLSLGPELKVLATNTELPLPYRALMEVPPFDLARAPARLAALGLWGAVGLMSLGLTAVQQRLGRTLRIALGLAILAWCVAEVVDSGPTAEPFEPPQELANLPPGGVANLPLAVCDPFAMLLQVFHGRPIVTGCLSRVTAEQEAHVGRLDQLARQDPRALADALQALGVGNVVIARGTPDDLVAALLATPLRVVDLRALN